MLDYYQLLGLSAPRLLSDEDRARAIQDVERARRRLAMQHHPDRNPSDVERATRTMQEINKAADYLLGYLRVWHAPAQQAQPTMDEWFQQWHARHEAEERQRQAERRQREEQERENKRQYEETARARTRQVFEAAWESEWYESKSGNQTIWIEYINKRVTIFTDKRTGQYKFVISDTMDDDTHFSKRGYATVDDAKEAAYSEMIARYF